MTLEDYLSQINSYNDEIEKNERIILQYYNECKNELDELRQSESISTDAQQETYSANSKNFTLKDVNGNIIKCQNKYQNGTTLEYNGITYKYDSNYGAFVKSYNKNNPTLCTKENISKFMIPKSILNQLNANVIVEFCPNTRNDSYVKDNNYFGVTEGASEYLKKSQKGELPISRIYNIDHEINNIYFEINQYWAGSRKNLGANGYNPAASGCLVYSMVNGCNYKAKDTYNENEVYNFLKTNIQKILSPFENENKNIAINDASKIQQITSSSKIIEVSEANRINSKKTYIIRTDAGSKGSVSSSGPHFVTIIPSGINGYCYVIDSNNSKIKPNHQYNPYMTYDEVINSIVERKMNGKRIALFELDYNL